MNLSVQYCAILREERGVSVEKLETQAADAGALYAALRKQYRFSLPPERLRVAVNDEFAEWSSPLKDGDSVVFIPPVAGG